MRYKSTGRSVRGQKTLEDSKKESAVEKSDATSALPGCSVTPMLLGKIPKQAGEEVMMEHNKLNKFYQRGGHER